jgi:hypothetical protein
MKTKKDIQGQLKRLVGNTGLDSLQADYNDVYGGWALALHDTDDPGAGGSSAIKEYISEARFKGGDFYYMLNAMNRLIERMRLEKKEICV